ncbi:MAG: T9SS type A sorting domain-containing protein [Bacteroidota bacterium]
MKKVLLHFVFILALSLTAQAQWINELHYDNTGGDVGEFVEVAGPAGTSLAGWSIVLYNGSGGASYNTINLSGTIPDEGLGFGALAFFEAGIQNGAPDGLALVDDAGNVAEFISYEGSFTATNGDAIGLTSTDIGVAETGSTPVGQSLQLSGDITVGGQTASPGGWTAPSASTAGALNSSVGQEVLVALPVVLAGFDVSVANKAVQVSWTTAAELNNDYFVVEHSTNGSQFKALEMVIGMGNSAATQNYDYIHEAPAQGMNYYRLRQVDFDGTATYSEIKTAQLEGKKEFKVFPTIATTSVQLALQEANRENGLIEVFNFNGQLLKTAILPAGSNNERFDVQDLEPGQYLIRLQVGQQVENARFIKL